MMTKRVFEFSKPEELEIAGEVFTLDTSDEKALKFQKEFTKARSTIEKIQALDIEKASDEEMEQAYFQSKEVAKTFFDGVLGEGAFDRLYEKSGKSLSNMMELMTFLQEVQSEKVDKVKKQAKNQYVKKGQK